MKKASTILHSEQKHPPVSNSQTEGQPPETRLAHAPAGSVEKTPDFATLVAGHADLLIAWIDSAARLVFVNPALCRALGYSPAELSFLRTWDLSPTTPESWPALWAEMKERESQTLVAELRSRSGGIVPVRVHVKVVTLEGEEYWLCCGHDLPEHQAAPERAPVLLEPTADAVFILNKGYVVDSACKSAEIFGCPRHQIIQELEEMLYLSGRMAPALRGQPFTFGWQSTRPDLSRFNIECTVLRIEIEGNLRLLAVLVDATSRRRSERTLAQLSGRLLQMQDEERRRIARELHDTTGQNLGALSINLSLLLANPALDPAARETIQENLALADASVREIRTMSYLLHPPLLDELGLVSAFRAYSEGYAERTGLAVDLDLPSSMPRLPQAIEIALFRIVQEGLANIHRHSGSRTARLRLKYGQQRVELEVADSGRGLPRGILDGEVACPSRIGVGIAGMRERARQLGGSLTIASSENGTTLHVVLPVTSAAA